LAIPDESPCYASEKQMHWFTFCKAITATEKCYILEQWSHPLPAGSIITMS